MRCELTDFKRCCFFIPLRHGILILGYLNLVSTILLIGLEGFVGISPPVTAIVSNYRGMSDFVRWLPRLLHFVELVFGAILLVGAHTKRPLLIRIYFYYGILTTVAALLTYLMMLLSPEEEQDWFWTWIELCFALTGFALQVYLLLLIRTELQKLNDQQKGQRYENHMADVVLEEPIGGGRNKEMNGFE